MTRRKRDAEASHRTKLSGEGTARGSDESDDLVVTLLAGGVIDDHHAKALRHKVGFSDADRARIHALAIILGHRQPEVSRAQNEMEATALHLAHLAVTALGRGAPVHAYASLIAHVVRNATIIAEDEGGRTAGDAFFALYSRLIDKLCSDGTGSCPEAWCKVCSHGQSLKAARPT
jgi:predicted transcriptional regulator